MYTSKFFAENEQEEIEALVARNGLAILVSSGMTGFTATHAPLLFEPGKDGSLVGHMARSNPHWQEMTNGAPTLAIFQAPGAYISPAHYVIEEDVPTWNYAAVHVHGRWEAIADIDETRYVLDHTVALYEKMHGSSWTMSDICPHLTASLEHGVYAFRIRIDRIAAAQKMSQDKQKADVQAVIKGLKRSGGSGAEVARRMQRVTTQRERHIKKKPGQPQGRR